MFNVNIQNTGIKWRDVYSPRKAQVSNRREMRTRWMPPTGQKVKTEISHMHSLGHLSWAKGCLFRQSKICIV